MDIVLKLLKDKLDLLVAEGKENTKEYQKVSDDYQTIAASLVEEGILGDLENE